MMHSIVNTVKYLTTFNTTGYKNYEDAINYNCSIKDLEILKKCRFPLNEEVFHCAIRNNNLEIMKWLKANKCPWDELAFTIAIMYCDLDTITWLRENNCPKGWGNCLQNKDYIIPNV